MRENARVFEWSRARERAAALLAAGDLTDEAIAKKLKVHPATLYRWKLVPEFRERVQQVRRELREAVLREGIADKQRRLLTLNTVVQGLERVIAERAADPAVADVPGGKTGHVVPEPMFVKVYRADGDGGDGMDGEEMTVIPKTVQLVHKFSVDTGTVKTLLETLKQAAIEMGEWAEKREHSGEVMVRQYVGVDPNEV